MFHYRIISFGYHFESVIVWLNDAWGYPGRHWNETGTCSGGKTLPVRVQSSRETGMDERRNNADSKKYSGYGLLMLAGIVSLIGFGFFGARWMRVDSPSTERTGGMLETFITQQDTQAFSKISAQKDTANTSRVPFDSALGIRIREFCRQAAKATGGGQQQEKTCLLNEQFSVYELADIDQPLPKKTVGYCKDVSDAKGGSYQVMLRCVKNQLSTGGEL